ncbi:MAG: hypothetical protein ACJAVN_000692 [Roseivirga sp.]|jgi:hypothetical protein
MTGENYKTNTMHNRHNTTSLINVILILTPFILLSCGGESIVEETEAQVDKQDSFQSYQLDLKGESILFADLIDNIEITRLEETKESLLAYVRQVEFIEDKMVIPSGDEGSIFVFSRTGEFLNKINRQGEGPEEYTRWADIWLENGVLAIHNFGVSVNRYDLEGNFISRDKLDRRASHLYPYKGGYALDKSLRYTQDSLQYSLVTLDSEMKLDKTFLPFAKFPGFQVTFSNNSLFSIEDDLFFFRMMSDTVYRIDTDTIVPYVHYDFQEDWYFQPDIEVSNAVFSEADAKGQVWFMSNKIGPNYIYLSTSQGEDFLIERKTGKSIRIDFRSMTDEKYQVSSVVWQGDVFLVSFQSTQLAEILEQLDPSQYKFTQGSTLEEIESSENPVLIRMKLKQPEDWNE